MSTLPFAVRSSSIHGRGAFATRAIRSGQRVCEYVGTRMDGDEAGRRAVRDDGHTMLFEVDADLVIDGSRGGNESRFVNHSCDPSCEIEIRGERVFICARRAIAPGDELTFDYGLMIDGPYCSVWTKRYACRCGAKRCRGTMLRLRAQNRSGPMYARLVAARRMTSSSRGVGAKPKPKPKPKSTSESKSKSKSKSKPASLLKSRSAHDG